MEPTPNPSSVVEETEDTVVNSSSHYADQSSVSAESLLSLAEEQTTPSQSGNSVGSTEEDCSTDAIARREDMAISSAKLFVLFFLLSLAVVVSYFWYRFTEASAEDSYHDEFDEYATKLVDIFFQKVEHKVLTASTLAMSLTSHVSHSSSMEWPFVSFSNFERRTAGPRRLTSATSVWFSPLVLEETRSLWETYATDNEGMLQQSNNFSVSFDPHGEHSTNDAAAVGADEIAHDEGSGSYRQVDWQVNEGIYRIADTNVAVPQEFGQTTYAPIWQSAPVSLTKTNTMYNQLSEDFRREVIEAMVELKTPFFSKSQLAGDDSSLVNDYKTEPHVYLYHPIFDSVQKTTVVGGLTFDLDWSSFWHGIVGGIPGPLIVVLENNCGQAYTYWLDGDSHEKFVGEGEPYYNGESSEGLVMESNYEDFAALFGYDVDQENVCSYRVKVYPTKEFEEEFLTNGNLLSAVGVGGIFILTAAVFIFYDCLVERRQARVMQSAKRSNAIVK
jgi:hypothetical protein